MEQTLITKLLSYFSYINPAFPKKRIVHTAAVFFLFIPLLNAQHAVSTLCGTSTQGAPLAGPNGICVSPDDSFLYIADYSDHRIRRVNISTHMVSNYAGNGNTGHTDASLLSSEFYFPSGIKTSSDGHYLYVADNGNCLIRRIDVTAGVVTTIAGVYNAFSFADNPDGLLAMFNQPVDLALAPGDSVLYISDSENHVIRKLNLLTTSVTTIAGSPGFYGTQDGTGSVARFHNPNGLSVSQSGNWLFVADAGNHKIRRIDLATYEVITLAGSGTAGYVDNANGMQAAFNIPQGVCVLPGDSLLYVMDTFNNRIRQIQLGNTSVTTIAGANSTISNHFADHASGLSALFWHPVNGALSAAGSELFVSDQENYRIRVVNTEVLVPVTIAETIPHAIGVSPNPAATQVTVSGISRGYFRLLTMQGGLLASGVAEQDQQIQLPAGLSPGIYMFSIQTPEKDFAIPIVIR